MKKPLIVFVLALVVLWLWRRNKARSQAVATGTAQPVVPNARGQQYPEAVATKNAGAVKPANTSRPTDPYPTAQEQNELAGIAWEDGSYTPAGGTRVYPIDPDGVAAGGDW